MHIAGHISLLLEFRRVAITNDKSKVQGEIVLGGDGFIIIMWHGVRTFRPRFSRSDDR